jgi:hypothetical protein
VLALDAALGSSTRRYRKARQRKLHCEATLGGTVKLGNDRALSEALSLGNELGASLGNCSLFTVSNSGGKEQGEQLSDALS